MKRSLSLLLLCLTVPAAFAQETTAPRIQLHGFGEWAYGRTDGNEYAGGNDEGDYDTVGFGLNASTAINDHLTITGQIGLRTRGEHDVEAELDYAFAQWRFSDALQLRAGRAKHPFGIYTEIYDIGTLRPFFFLPASIYGPSEIAAHAYNGLGLTGMRQTGGGTLDYDVYVGEITFNSFQRVLEGAEGEEELEEGETVRDVIGGRLRFHTPIDGLSFGGSAYTGVLEEDEHELGEEGNSRHVGLGLHAEYARAPLTLRAELARHRETEEAEADAFYIEAAYRLGEHFELAGRYDHFDIAATEDDDEDAEHRDLSFGVNYWFNPSFVLKASVHRVQGFAVAVPHGDDDDLDDETNAFVFGAQFSF